jgi:hypothetical protein
MVVSGIRWRHTVRLLVFLLLSVSAATAYALPSLEDVEHAVHRNDYISAESMTREVVTAQPNSAKPHYILAEILAHEGKLNEARTQALQAKQLDPAIRFTTPDKFARFEAELNGNKPVPRTATEPHKAAETSSGGSSFLWIVLIVGGLLAFFAFRRRSAPPSYGAYNNPNAPMPGQPGYGAPGYPPAGYPPGSGAGHTVAAGLSGLAAGMLAEHLIEGAMGHHQDANGNPVYTPQGDNAPSETLENRPIDFGSGNDWGNDSGGGDSGGGFDSGGGSDWS